ncbi:MAG: saccharopine dehydrogenase C-terminal domain-containing protein [Acidobacteriota bacterium]
MAKVVVLGAGAAGEVAVRLLARSGVFDEVVAVDIRPERLRAIRRQYRTRRLRTVEADLSVESHLRRACKGASVILNCALPNINMAVMNQALRQKAHYIDLAAMAYPDPRRRSGVVEQIKLAREFRKRDLTGILGLGVAPGMTDLFAALAAQRFGALKEVRIRVYGSGYAQVEGHTLAPLFSPETFLDEVLYPAPVWRDGRLEKLPPFNGREVYRFPNPLGPATCYNVNNEETETMPRFIDREIRFIDFKYAIAPERKSLIEGLYHIGLTSSKPIKVQGKDIVPYHVLLALLPKSDSVVDRARGHTCVLLEVVAAGGNIHRRFWTIMSHAEARRRHGVTATAYMTGTPPAVAAESLQLGSLQRRGVMSAGGLEAGVLLKGLLHRGMPLFEGDPFSASGAPLAL